MGDILATALVVLVLAVVLAGLTRHYPRAVRPWVWFAFIEYMLCAVVQYLFGGDAKVYERIGSELARLMGDSFGWAASEVTALLLHRPSAFDDLVVLPGTNTGSMFAATAWLVFLAGGSPYAAHALVAGLSMFGALGIYRAAEDLCPNVSPVRLFAATVVFPSIAFWTSNLHKESFCLMGVGFLLAALRAVVARRFRALLYAPGGAVLVIMFRPPAIPPLVVGLAAFFVLRRIQKTRGPAGKMLFAPVYIALGLVVTALGVIALGSIVPALSLDNIVESVAVQQASWDVAEGGSTFGTDAPAEASLGGQLLATPLGFLNGILRPQLFDVRNPAMFVSAIEMTVVLWLLVRAIVLHGIRGLVNRVQQTPFLALCTVITIVGCSIVGLTTRNMGSLARYRAPFLPFYGVFLAALSARAPARQLGSRRPGSLHPLVAQPLRPRLAVHRRGGNATQQP